MSARTRRHRTGWLGACVALLAAAWIILACGLGRDAGHADAATPRPLPPMPQVAHARATPPLSDFAQVWQRPLLNASRRPLVYADATGTANIDQMQLTGIILTGDMRMALLTRTDDAHTERVREGAHVGDSNWVLTSLAPRQAQFTNHGRVIRLTLKFKPAPRPAASTRAPADRHDGPREHARAAAGHRGRTTDS